MKMKKHFNFLLMAALVGSLSLTTVACSDDDDDKKEQTVSNVTIDDDIIAHGLQVNPNGETMTVNVKMNGTWSAAIENGTEDDNDWAIIENEHLTFSDDRTLKLSFTPNKLATDRNATLEIFGIEGEPISVKISQRGLGTNAATGSALSFEGQGLGHSADVRYAMDTAYIHQQVRDGKEFDWTHLKKENMIYNMNGIKKLVDAGALNPQTYVEVPIPTYDLVAHLLDSTVCQDKDFGVGIHMSLSFGFIEFSAGVEYTAKKKEQRGHIDYSITRNAPMYNAVVSPVEIATYAVDQSADAIEKYGEEYAALNEKVEEKYGSWEELKKKNAFTYNSWRKKLDKYRPNFGNVFSTGFSAALWAYYKAYMEENMEAADKALNRIDEDFSPFFITGGNWGGSMSILARIDSTSMRGKDSLWAELKGDLASFGSVNGSLHLSTEGMNLYRNLRFNIKLLGGDPAVGDQVSAWLMGPNQTDYSKLQGVLKSWIESMQSPNSDNANDKNCAMPTEFFYTPIWRVMDPEYRDYARDWFIKKYASNPSVSTFFGVSEGTVDEKGAGSRLCGDNDDV